MAYRILICFLSILGSILLATSCNSKSEETLKIRNPGVAGAFYPADSALLASQIDDFFDQVPSQKLANVPLALIAPHAGYVYSGHVAAHSYKLLDGQKIRRVVVIAPSHIEPFSGAAIYNGDAYQTPLGPVYIDQKFSEQLAAQNPMLHLSTRGHEISNQGRMEHSLEVQLPFLQRVLEEFKLVAVVMGDQSYSTCRALGSALASLLKDDSGTVLIASSDLSHYHEYSEAVKRDKNVIRAMEEWDYYNLLRNLNSRIWEACGGGPIVAVMMASEKLGSNQVRILKYANSGDVAAGDKSHVVGYTAAAFYHDPELPSDPRHQFELSDLEQHHLLQIAREAVETAVKNEQIVDCSDGGYEALSIERGAFVTLNKHGRLRGCIGYTSPVKPLYLTIRDVAISAALNDPRFPAVKPNELDEITYEISVLSPFHKVIDPDQIKTGEHGLLIKLGRSEGLLLPQVASNNNWDRETFLNQTCLKAGLPENSWQNPDADVFMFSAFVFGNE